MAVAQGELDEARRWLDRAWESVADDAASEKAVRCAVTGARVELVADNPLVARVAVNRLWELAFGAGLVATSQDFGLQGAWPSHPELLDWLAVELRESGWDVKSMLTRIVTSATYRQSSRVTPELYARDPENRLWAQNAIMLTLLGR